jgi:hypothetical protein
VIVKDATLFRRDLLRTQMKLLESRPFSNGCVMLRYAPIRAAWPQKTESRSCIIEKARVREFCRAKATMERL